MPERRETKRDNTDANGVRCETTLPDGSVLVGRVSDCSEGGANIVGETSGAKVGDAVELVFVFPSDERVRYGATIKHIAPGQHAFGIKFESEPTPVDGDSQTFRQVGTDDGR